MGVRFAPLWMGTRPAKGKVERDEEALRTMEALGHVMGWLLKNVHRVAGRHGCRFLGPLRTVA